jgi:hypothetical protein
MESHIYIETVAESQGLLGADGTSNSARFGGLLSTIFQAIMVIALLLVLFYLVWGAFDWITSAGDKGKLDSARNKMMNAVMGIIILSATTAIFIFVQWFIGVQVFTFTGAGAGNTVPTGYSCQPYSNLCPAGTGRVTNDKCGTSCKLPDSVCCG